MPTIPRPGSMEELYRLIADGITDHSIVLLDPDGYVVSWTRAAETIEGYRADEILGEHFTVFVPLEDREAAMLVLQRAAAMGRVELEAWRIRKTGERYWANVVLSATRSETGEVTGFVRVVRDQTARRNAEEALRESQEALRASEQYFRNLIEHAADAITILNDDGTVRYSTPSIQRLLGYRPEDREGRSAFELIHPDDHGEARRVFAALREHPDGIGRARLRVRAQSGEWRNLEFTASNLLQDPLVAGFVVNTRDISEQTIAEEALRASEERYRTIIETAGEGIVIRDSDDMINFANQRMADLLGYTIEDLIGRHFRDIVSAEEGETFKELLSRRRPGPREQFDLRARRADGTEIWGIVTQRPMTDARGKYVGALTMFTDITGRKLLEEQLRQAQKMEAVGRLAGGIAHDFNNLLTAIRGHAELLLSEMSAHHPLRADLVEINRAAERASTLTRQLLAFSRRQILQPRILDMDIVVVEMERLIRRLIGEDIELQTRPAARGARVRADRGQLEQVLMNLAVNARDAMPNGGRLTIETSIVDLDEKYARFHPGSVPGAYVRMGVADTGIGMDARTLSHVFEPFFTTKAVGKGTGLGLATVYGVVKQSGGYIAVQSEAGSGTSFDIFLPRVLDASDPARESNGRVDPERTGQTVLLAEDEDAVRSLASRVLRKHGYQVLEARDGADALRVADSYAGFIHILLTDVVMPRMGGRELVERLTPVRPGMRVLYMSGYTDDALVHHGVLTGSGTWFLEKPFTPDSLAMKLREVIEAD
jgi:two-component system, cell cycle sensor histidine kinase and response regulator CckA